jgi:hypothetical protein
MFGILGPLFFEVLSGPSLIVGHQIESIILVDIRMTEVQPQCDSQ